MGAALQAELCGKVEDNDRASKLFDLALTSIDASQEKWYEAEVRRMLGEHQARSQPGNVDATDSLRKAMDMARDQGAKLWELRAGTSLAQLLSEAGMVNDARQLLEPLCGWYADGPVTPDLERARTVLDAVA